jgi:hypothetical protein
VDTRIPPEPEHHRALPQPADDEALLAPDPFDGEREHEGDGDDLQKKEKRQSDIFNFVLSIGTSARTHLDDPVDAWRETDGHGQSAIAIT